MTNPWPSKKTKKKANKNKAVKKRVTPSPATDAIDLTQEDDVLSPNYDNDDYDDELAVLGTCDFNIVGIRYYSGVVHPGEYCLLVREPRNQYDPNAIRVDNIHNQQVGHIKRQQAAKLAPLMDNTLGLELTLDATIPSAGNQWTIPVHLEICGRPTTAMPAELLAKTVKKELQTYMTVNPLLVPSRTAAAAAPNMTKKTMDWQTQQQELDDMFDKQTKEQLAQLPQMHMPSQLQDIELFDYQKIGIRWLVSRETNNQMPFYREEMEQGEKVWFCEITNASAHAPPKPVLGGILADEMGLGKTIQTLGLVLLNPAEGHAFERGRLDPSAGKPVCTLIVCPVSVGPSWANLIETHVKPGTLTVSFYQGPKRKELLPDLKANKFDILITSFQTLAYEFSSSAAAGEVASSHPKPAKRRKGGNDNGASIFDETFHRIVLDEAHTIRSSKSRLFQAVSALKGDRKLCLTGTPFVNKADDIHSLLSFLRVEPLQDKNVFRRAITQPIQNGDDIGLARLRTTMAHVALRRSKALANVPMVKKEVQLCSVSFPEGSNHTAVHKVLFDTARAAFDAAISGGDGEALSNYQSICETLLRIRQACCSGVLVPKERRKVAREIQQRLGGKKLTAEEGKLLLEKLRGAFDSLEANEAPECSICLCEFQESSAIVLKTCNHIFCAACIEEVTKRKSVCPLCRMTFTSKDMIEKSAALEATDPDSANSISDIDDEDFGRSPKIEALLASIKEMYADEKGVIFSQFTSFLDLAQKAMVENGYKITRIDGSMDSAKRLKAMKDFNSDDHGSPRFILCSLHAAGCGINLTRGNVAFLLDVWWNESIENQAMDRVHRLGQTRDVRVYRFVMKDSIEERIVKLQETKGTLGKGAMEKLTPTEKRKARIMALKDLFLVGKSDS